VRRTLLFLLLLCGCSGPKLPFLGENARILAFGDSLTQGVGAAEGRDYPAMLSALCECEVINAGISGETSAQGLARIGDVLDETQPDLLLLLEGGNDVLRGLDKSQLKANLEGMILAARTRQVPVLLVAVPDKSLLLSPLPLYEELADQYGLPLLDDTVSDLLATAGMKSDGVHFNNQGYQALAEAVFANLQASGAF